MSDAIRTYIDLQRVMHDALRAQHPEWVQTNGESPTCDAYEARFAELLELFTGVSDHSTEDAKVA